MSKQDVYLGRIESIGGHQLLSGWLSAKHPLRHLCLALFTVAVSTAVLGCIAIYSATRPSLVALGRDPNFYLKRQLAFLALAMVIFVISLLFDYRQLRGLAPLIYLAGIGLLILVLSPIGHTTLGAQRWITVGILQIQPSEIMKIALIVALAAIWGDKGTDPGLRKVLLAMALAAVPAGLICLQPDLGTVLVMVFLAFSIVLVAGARLRWIALLVVLGIGAFALVLHLGLLHQYQVQRLTAFLDPKSSNQAAYNLRQSRIAVSSG